MKIYLFSTILWLLPMRNLAVTTNVMKEYIGILTEYLAGGTKTDLFSRIHIRN
jgi:hypothetical protein